MMDLQDPVKMLVDMARRGEIDPWNVDVVEVADKFLQELERAKKLDLRVSGRVLLYAAILVRMKADILAEEAVLENNLENNNENENEDKCENDENYIIEDYPPEIGFFENDLDYTCEIYDIDVDLQEFKSDEVISYLLSPRRKVRRFTTLKDLLAELKKAEKGKRKKEKVRKGDEVKRVIEIPHEEDMEDTIERIERELIKLFEVKGIVMFSELVMNKRKSEMLSYFVSLLYLSFRKKIEIEQERIYEDDIVILPVEGSNGRKEVS